MKNVIVSGSFDDLRSRHVRFLEEASKRGQVHVLLWSDAAVRETAGAAPKFPQAERAYLLNSIRFVASVNSSPSALNVDALAPLALTRPDAWIVDERGDSPANRAFAQSHGLGYEVIKDADLAGFPEPPPDATPSTRPKVIVTGCYDWFHSGHVRFFEECAALGDLHAVVGHDANIRLLKGEGHPLLHQDERRYMVGAIRFVRKAFVSTGHGWLDAEPEIGRIRPEIYAVNEDGDKPEKRAYCERHGIRYVVLQRTPKDGLPRRQSTDLRGF